jgi:hypothetical protein
VLWNEATKGWIENKATEVFKDKS